jgi:hypothetical protein
MREVCLDGAKHDPERDEEGSRAEVQMEGAST